MADDKIEERYVLGEQIGFLLRKANQRHTEIFSKVMPEDMTPTRFAAMVKLYEFGHVSQNELGRMTAMDVATIKGVVDRLKTRNLVQSTKDSDDARRQLVSLTPRGEELIQGFIPLATDITAQTTDALTAKEAKTLQTLLMKIS